MREEERRLVQILAGGDFAQIGLGRRWLLALRLPPLPASLPCQQLRCRRLPSHIRVTRRGIAGAGAAGAGISAAAVAIGMRRLRLAISHRRRHAAAAPPLPT